jgi:glutamyl-tRNA synthetase
MVNYLALLGWSPGGDREVLTRQELVDEFRLEQVKSAPAFFDGKKLADVNANYLRSLSSEEMVERAGSWLTSRWAPIAPLVQERARTLGEVYAMVDFLFLPEIKIDEREWAKLRRQQPLFVGLLEAAEARLGVCDWEAGAIREATVEAGVKLGVDNLGKAQAPVRLAVTGRLVGPPLFEALVLLGRRRTLERLGAAHQRAALEDQAAAATASG